MQKKSDHPQNSFTVGAFAKAAGVNVETIRFYQRKSLLPQPDKPLGSIRRYGDADVARVRFVKSAQQLGFSLDEVAELLQLHDGGAQTHYCAPQVGRLDEDRVGVNRPGSAMRCRQRPD